MGNVQVKTEVTHLGWNLGCHHVKISGVNFDLSRPFLFIMGGWGQT